MVGQGVEEGLVPLAHGRHPPTPGRVPPRRSDERQRFVSLLSGVGGPQWAAPTRLEDWTVRDLAVHVAWAMSMRPTRSGGAGRDVLAPLPYADLPVGVRAHRAGWPDRRPPVPVRRRHVGAHRRLSVTGDRDAVARFKAWPPGL
ncbi:MAG: maleylpyruvate isomerase N-terminal domain-containing protein [Acidimicrobiales bacterium]